ncbi:MAG TPA: hypothetical protein VFB12_24755 [Ktedonobacteraceae bacterium]|nr:hypothetical protein [Ktedonobacteraceae bacterium]
MSALGIAGQTINLKVRWNDFQIVSRSLTTAHLIQDAQTMRNIPSLNAPPW